MTIVYRLLCCALVSSSLVFAESKLPINQIQIKPASHWDDSGGVPSNFIQVEDKVIQAVLSKGNLERDKIMLYKVDINNDGALEFVVVQPGDSAAERDIIGPVFQFTNDSLKELRIPLDQSLYTNFLLPIFQNGKSGVQINLVNIVEKKWQKKQFVWTKDKMIVRE